MRPSWMTKGAPTEGGSACGARRSFSGKRDLRWPYVLINLFGVVCSCFWQKYRTGWALLRARVLSCSMFESTGIPGDTMWSAPFQFSKDWAYGQKSANGGSICRPPRRPGKKSLNGCARWVSIRRGFWSDCIQDPFGLRNGGQRRVSHDS
jgi:hypothetical protein